MPKVLIYAVPLRLQQLEAHFTHSRPWQYVAVSGQILTFFLNYNSPVTDEGISMECWWDDFEM